MTLLKVMLLSVLYLGVITTSCGRFLGFCPSYRGPDSLWFLGTIYASIACSVVLVSLFPFLAMSFTFWFVVEAPTSWFGVML